MLGLIVGVVAGLVVTVVAALKWPAGKARALRPLVPPLFGFVVALLLMYLMK